MLVVDDEANIRDLIEVALRFHGFTTVTAATGEDALRTARRERPDLVLLDVMLPGMDGFEVCRRLRADGDQVPVIFLTARDTPSDTVTGLTLGGDDYVTKPFSIEALIARVRAVLRRVAPAASSPDTVLRVADLELDEAHWTVRRGGVDVDLSPTEFRLLAYLMRNAGVVLSRAQLLARGGLGPREPAGRRDLHQLPAAQAGPARRAAHPHPARGRLRAAAMTLNARLLAACSPSPPPGWRSWAWSARSS